MAKISARGCVEVARAKDIGWPRKGCTYILRSDRKILTKYSPKSGYSITATLKPELSGEEWCEAYEKAGCTVNRTYLSALKPAKKPRKIPADPKPRPSQSWQSVVDSTHVAESNIDMLRRVRRLSFEPMLARSRWDCKKQGRDGKPGAQLIRQARKALYRQAIARHAANREQYKEVMGHSPYPSEAMVARAIERGFFNKGE